MNEYNLNNKIINATKWSTITELIAKFIVPITNMILARVLVPEAFGVVATVTMIISFVDMFTDAGFQKYIIQHNFKDDIEKNNFTNVAFWSNLIISIILWFIIIIFSKNIAIMVGNSGLENVISIACIQLPLTSFSSLQIAIYRRSFDFKTLFLVRLIGIIIPFFVTIPLALLGFEYWALIFGSIIGTLINAIVLTVKSKWRPQLFYSFNILKEMISFSFWSLIESISIWLTIWIDNFIIGSTLSSYYLGIYKTSSTTVNTIFALVTATTTPILFSALSRVQNDKYKFNHLFFSMQKVVAYLVLPMSVGIFLYSDLIVKILLGSKWGEASYVMGVWALTSGIVIVLGHYSSEVYRAKGKPKLSFIAQLLHLVVLVPVCIIASKYSFDVFVTARALIRLQLVIIHILIMQFIIKIPIKDIFKNILIPTICTIFMMIIGIFIKNQFDGVIWGFIGILICILSYILFLLCFKESRKDVLFFINKLVVKSRTNLIRL